MVNIFDDVRSALIGAIVSSIMSEIAKILPGGSLVKNVIFYAVAAVTAVVAIGFIIITIDFLGFIFITVTGKKLGKGEEAGEKKEVGKRKEG
ncbi:hypothetical protein F5887DRAFT_969332 [Amanita rubescens]|nr:hypothetical protein F5887DRAFT_969332 [Amanita rubescens]